MVIKTVRSVKMRQTGMYLVLIIISLMLAHSSAAQSLQQGQQANATLPQVAYQTTSQPTSDYAYYTVTQPQYPGGPPVTNSYYYTNFTLVGGFNSGCRSSLWHAGPGTTVTCTRNGATFSFTETQNNDTTVVYGSGQNYPKNNMFTVSGQPDAVWVSYSTSCGFFSTCYHVGYASINQPPTGSYLDIYGVYYAGFTQTNMPSSCAGDMNSNNSPVTCNSITYDKIHDGSALMYEQYSTDGFPEAYMKVSIYQNESNKSQYYAAFPYETVSSCSGPSCRFGGTKSAVYAAGMTPALSLSVSPSSFVTVLKRQVTFTLSAKKGYGPYSYTYSVSGPGKYSESGSGTSESFTFYSQGSYLITFTVTDAGGQTATATAQVTVNKPTIPPQCNPYTPTAGNCIFLNGSTITTGNYGNYAGTGSFSTSQNGPTSNTPVIANVILSNLANNQYLLTCPNTPNPSNTLEYIVGNGVSRIGGDACLANANSLKTNVSLETNVTWSQYQVANGTINVHFINLTQAYLDDLGYVGEANNSGSYAYNISNGYGTNTLIYQNVPSQTQYGIWSWYAKYADLSSANNPSFLSKAKFAEAFPSLDAPFQYLTVDVNETNSAGNSYTCAYNYTYSIGDSLDSIQSANITIPKQINAQGDSYVNINGINHKPYTYANGGNSVYSQSCTNYVFYQSCSTSGNSGYDSLWAGQNDIVIGSNTFTLASPNNVATVKVYSSGKYTSEPGNYYFYDNGATNTYWVPYCILASSGLVGPTCKQQSSGLALGVGTYTANIYFGSAPNGQQWTNSSIFPYFLYNISVPATYSNLAAHAEYLNLSYDTYSPYNYLNPANALEPLPIQMGSGLFATINGILSVLPLNITSTTDPNVQELSSAPQAYFISDLTPATANSLHLGFLKSLFGNYTSAAVSSPSFIAASPNDNIYALNYTSIPSDCFGFCISTTTDSYLYDMRFIPYGYFNVSNEQPDSVAPEPNSIAWNESWKSYWNASLAEQSANLYIVGVSNVSRVQGGIFGISGGFFGWGKSIIPKALTFNAIPTAITTDDAGDVFFSGVDPNNGKLTLGYRLANGTSNESAAQQVPPGFHASDMLASDPGGQYLYLANSSFANVTVYGSVNATYVGEIALNYSNPLNMLNITSYLAHGGPYGNAQIAAAYSGAPTSNDISSYHHPIALADVGGIQYVMDNWTFTVNGLKSTVLTLRAFTSNGIEVSIDPQSYYDLIPSNSGLVSVSTGSLGGALSNPPYGWPLAANISLPDGTYVSYCAYGCTYTPNSLDTAYPPIASMVEADGANVGQRNFSIGINFNGTVYIISHSYISGVKSCTSSGVHGGIVCTTTPSKPLYAELLSFQPQIVNYTTVSNMANSHYTCYVAPDASSSTASNTPCTVEQQNIKTSSSSGSSSEPNPAWSILSDMYGPILGVPSSFKYVENLGYPTDYVSAVTALASTSSSLSSSSSSPSSANIIANTINVGNGIPSNSLPISPSQLIPRTSLTSNISGYVLVPYKASFSLSEDWTPSSQAPKSSNGDSCPSSYSFPSSVNKKYTIFTYGVSKVNSSTNTTAIEGGSIFLQYFGTGVYYSPELSDANLIMPPRIGYEMFTNRLIGEAYVNLTATTSGEQNPQMILNQSHNYNYYESLHYLDAFGKSVPAYATEVAVPDNVVGNLGSVSGYYNPNNYLPKSNNFTLSNFTNDGGIASIVNAYHIASTLDSLGIDMTGHKSILGYDRLVYNLIDRFGNKISMPLDIDMANITSLSLSAVDNIDPTNPNQSTIAVKGFAGYVTGSTPVSVNPLPAGQKIYVYYDTNINFYPSQTYQSLQSYAQYAENCAYGSNAYGCTLANPTNATQNGGNTVGGEVVSSLVTYSPQYVNGQSCSPQPSSLLAQQNYWECNIYGDYGLKSSQIGPSGQVEYCLPDFINGTGQFTSQLGLVGIATTNSSGGFSMNVPACGTGTSRIIAEYYGVPSPQPNLVSQVPLAYSANTVDSSNAALYISTPEYSYTYSPNQTIQSLPIGSYALSLGDIEAVLLVAIAAILIMLAAMHPRKWAFTHG